MGDFASCWNLRDKLKNIYILVSEYIVFLSRFPIRDSLDSGQIDTSQKKMLEWSYAHQGFFFFLEKNESAFKCWKLFLNT